MDEQKLVKLLKEHFPSKEEFVSLDKKVDTLDWKITALNGAVATLDGKVSFLDREVRSLRQEFLIFKDETVKSFNDASVSLKVISNNIEDLKAANNEIEPSVKALDKLLEQNPAERIDRLEKHVGLPVFIPSLVEDEG